MKRALLSLFVAVSVLLTWFVPVVQADTRCGGFGGIQVWDSINKGGRTKIFCGTLSLSNLHIYQQDPNCSLFCLTWGDTISSYETFNRTSMTKTSLYVNANYNSGCSTCRVIVTTGNGYVPNIGVFWNGTCCNDVISSIRT